MLIKDVSKCNKYTAGDGSTVSGVLHPDKEQVSFRYSIAHCTLPIGKVTLKHRLVNPEVYYILEGEGVMHVDDETQNVSSDFAISIPPGAVRYIENKGSTNLRFLCIVDPAWHKEEEEIL